MKGFGIVLVVIGVLFMIGGIFFAVTQPAAPAPAPKPASALEVTAENGESMAILPLLGIVSLATGGALIVAAHITRKGG